MNETALDIARKQISDIKDELIILSNGCLRTLEFHNYIISNLNFESKEQKKEFKNLFQILNKFYKKLDKLKTELESKCNIGSDNE